MNPQEVMDRWALRYASCSTYVDCGKVFRWDDNVDKTVQSKFVFKTFFRRVRIDPAIKTTDAKEGNQSEKRSSLKSAELLKTLLVIFYVVGSIGLVVAAPIVLLPLVWTSRGPDTARTPEETAAFENGIHIEAKEQLETLQNNRKEAVKKGLAEEKKAWAAIIASRPISLEASCYSNLADWQMPSNW